MMTRTDLVGTRRYFKALLGILLLIMARAGQADAVGSAVAPQPVKILAMGTSLTQGYGLPPGTEFTTQLQAALKRSGIDAVVTNAGVSGDTTAGGLSRLDWSLADHPDAAIWNWAPTTCCAPSRLPRRKRICAPFWTS
jgi:hypothetical protein